MRVFLMAVLMILVNTICTANGYEDNQPDPLLITARGHRCANGSLVDDECSCEEMKTLCKKQPCLNLTRGEDVMRRHMCDGVFDCSDLSDECLCDRRTLENAATYDICKKIFNEKQDEGICGKGNISCNTSTDDSQCIHTHQICDMVDDCTGGWDEKLCRSSSLDKHDFVDKKYVTYFSCDKQDTEDIAVENITTTTGYENGIWLLIDWRRKFDGKADCLNYADEWHENFVYCGDDTTLKITRCKGADGARLFASPLNAVDSLLFPCVEWFLGIFGVIGNALVAFNSVIAIIGRKARSRNHSVTDADMAVSNGTLSSPAGGGKMINHILVLFLCTSDWLMSLQIILMASANEYLRGSYWQHDKVWPSSSTCFAVGSLAVFSTQASAFMIVVISYVRLYAVSKPFKPLRVRCVVIACFSAYALAAFLMAIPLASSVKPVDLYFTTSVQVQNPPQSDADILERDKLEEYVRNMVHLSEEPEITDFENLGWAELESIAASINPKFGNWRYFGYYSEISICIPPIVSHWSDPGLLYSFFLLIIDFVAFLLVFIAYYVVFRTTRRGRDSCMMAVGCCANNRPLARQEVEINSNEEIPTRQRARSMTRDVEDYEMQKRILWIIGTDCVCWAPVCILTLACMININIKGTTTLFLAMFAVQMNCFVNPLVYSRRVRIAIRRAASKCKSKLSLLANCLCKQNASSEEQSHGEENITELPNNITLTCIDTDDNKSTCTDSLDDAICETDSQSIS